MQGVLSYLQGFADSVLALFDFVFALFRDTITFLKLIAKIPSYLIYSLSWMPGELISLMGILFSVVILYKVLGREG